MWKDTLLVDPTTAQTGVLTLGNICTNLFRNNCIWTGFIPVFSNGAFGAELQLKMPKFYGKLKIGTELVLYMIFRSTISTDMGTANNRVISSFNYKSYS